LSQTPANQHPNDVDGTAMTNNFSPEATAPSAIAAQADLTVAAWWTV
jgi:hypothetical protein